MKTTKLEAYHRSLIFDIVEGRGWNLTYYKDVEIEAAILPLVELLNNEWTLTAYSCGGHWQPAAKFQYPYVAFHVLHQPRVWKGIMRKTWEALMPHISEMATVDIMETHELPDTQVAWCHWRFCPRHGSIASAPKVFRNERHFLETLGSLIKATCEALETVLREKYVERFSDP
ncbi:MAG: hypothetical protein E4H02_13135 [Lentisphaerales bacterium]|nr:MAG: hypothetical protein E4H02_13135 [Lentisphaerales bacterium]